MHAQKIPHVLTAAGLLYATLGCEPKPPPPKLPPTQVAHIQTLDDPTGQRRNVVDDAVQVGSNVAKISYNCAPPNGKNVEGNGRTNVPVGKCEYDQGTKTLTLSNDSKDDCPTFLLTLTDYHGRGTYNPASLVQASFGVARVRQSACRWEGEICMNWSRAGVHPEANCTFEITSDGGLQFGQAGATISGTFTCSAFVSPFSACAGVSAVPGCGITAASFSVAGCAVSGSQGGAPPPPPPRKRR